MAKVRVSQAWLEATADHDSDLRVSQAVAEALGRLDGDLRASQIVGEVLGKRDDALHASQIVVEVLGVIAGPNMPNVTASGITTDAADLTGTAFEQGTGSSAVHESSRWLVRNAHTNELVYDSGEVADLLFHEIAAGGLPTGTDLIPGAMYKNADQQWSLFPGTGTQFTTSTTSTEAAIGLQFWEGDDDGPTVFIETYVSIGTQDTVYGDWVVDEDIPIPTGARYIIPCAYKDGSELTDIRIKQLQIDRGLVSSGYHPRSYVPAIDDESVITPAGFDLSDQSGAFTIDWALGHVALVTLGAGAVMSWDNIAPFSRNWLALKQDGVGGRTVTWPAAAKHEGGIIPTLTTTAGAVDVFVLLAESASIVHVHTYGLDSK